MSSQKTFIVQYPPQYGVITSKLDDSDHFENTLFPDVYEGCWQSVENIIRHNGGNVENGRSFDSRAEDSAFQKSTSEPFVNPIIAITGSRGSGKSSAMYSFAEYLKTRKNLPYSFSILPPIDATQFGKNESVIGNITASMYREYSNNNADLSVDKKRDFVRLAKEVNNTAVMYSTGEWFKCGDDLLQDSEKVGNLRTRLHELIMNYLNLRSGNSSDTNKYLVIMLDDLDMCSEGAYSIIEEIRKFLCMRNVIILMTMQSTQLRTVLQASYTTAFGQVDDKTKPQIRNISMELAFRSYEKLFPAARCHAMPVWNADRMKEYDLAIENGEKNSENQKEDIYSVKKDHAGNEVCSDHLYGQLPEEDRSKVLYRTLHMIWRKTLLIPVCSKDGEHLLIPNNLRSLHNFIAMFGGMNDAIDKTFIVRIPQDDKKQPLPYALIPGLKDFDNFIQAKPINTHILDKNLAIFENYLLDNLSTYGESLNHNEENQKLAETLQNLILEMHTVPLERLNAKIVGDILDSYLPGYIKEAFKNIKCEVDTDANADANADGEIHYLKKAVSYADCISIGDVLYVLGKISVKTRCRYIAYLVEVIRTMWSIQMTREFYRKSNWTENSIKVSDSFRKTVGGLIVDANTTTFTGISPKGDWYTYREDSREYDMLFFATFTKVTNSSDEELVQRCLDYRSHNNLGEPYYTDKEHIEATTTPICHYLAYYTNALEELGGRIIYFPFYSLDFMYRFYEEFRSGCRGQKYDHPNDPEKVFKILDGKRIDAMTKILETVSHYIPLFSSIKDRQYDAIVQIFSPLETKYENEIDETVKNRIATILLDIANATEDRDKVAIWIKKLESLASTDGSVKSAEETTMSSNGEEE